MGTSTPAERAQRATEAANRAVRIRLADEYLAARTGTYAQRCVRYDAALGAMYEVGLFDISTVVDVGSGWGEFGARLHRGRSAEGHHVGYSGGVWWQEDVAAIPSSRARYVPVDACIDGVDLERWTPPRDADWFVCLEVLEHLRDPIRLIDEMVARATRGVVVSTPNPATTDVLGMDSTHRYPISQDILESCGFEVEPRSFCGQPDDSLFGVWTRG